jgi:predicted nucleic acid-binding protein
VTRGTNGWLIDSNVISEFGKRRPNVAVLSFIAEQELESLYVSCVTMAELRSGVIASTDVTAAGNIGIWLDQTIRPMFAERIVNVTEPMMLRWVSLVDEGRRKHHTYSQPDLIIAAQALELGLTLVTRNTPDFERTGVPILNPWLL